MKTYYVSLAVDVSAYALDVPVLAENEEDLQIKLKEQVSELEQIEMEVAWDTATGFRAISYKEGDNDDAVIKDFPEVAPLPLSSKLYWDIGQDVVWFHRQLSDGTIGLEEFAKKISESIELRTPK